LLFSVIRGALSLFLHTKFPGACKFHCYLQRAERHTLRDGALRHSLRLFPACIFREIAALQQFRSGHECWCGRWDLNPHGISPKGF
jgi:hypothetical protein